MLHEPLYTFRHQRYISAYKNTYHRFITVSPGAIYRAIYQRDLSTHICRFGFLLASVPSAFVSYLRSHLQGVLHFCILGRFSSIILDFLSLVVLISWVA